ncbi:MAG: DUF4190 domain-containing protein [Anaerolineales bacterium]|nr:DUF4190 domain-containing protein [Anaerolineales bacterium]
MSQYPNYSNSPSGGPTYVQNSTTAIISLIAGILGLTLFPFLGSIVAVITGRMAKNEIAESYGRLGGENLAQIGLVLGWIGLGLSLIGCCVVAAMFVLPFLLAAGGIAVEGMSWVFPLVAAFL